MVEGTSCSAVVAATFAFVLFVVGFSTPFWTLTETDTAKAFSGIWYGCAGTADSVDCAKLVLDSTPDWMRAVQALQVFGLVLGLVGLIVVCVWACKPYSKALGFIAFAVFLIGMGFGGTSLGVYAANVANESYSFCVSAAASLIYLITALIAVIGACKATGNKVY